MEKETSVNQIPHIFAIPQQILKKKIWKYIQEDLEHGDLSSGFIPKDVRSKAKIICKSSGIIAGLEEAKLLFEDAGLTVKTRFQDGDPIEKSKILLSISGKLREILMIERTALNFLMHLSSIASSTYDYVQKIREYSSNVILATTRKVTPGFGWFEKKAVYYGGGDTHRWNLGDMVMFKDTHRTFFHDDLAQLLQSAKQTLSFSKKIELEVESVDDIPIALENGADIIMLDNMSPNLIQKSLSKLKKGAKSVLFEASGNITLENIHLYAQSGIDIISTSAPIFRPHHWMDYSLRLDK